MKKFLLPMLAGAMALASCSKIDPVVELNKYDDYVVCAYDDELRTAWATDHCDITVKGDMTSSLYTVIVENVPLYEGAPLRSDTLSRMIQYFENTTPDGKEGDIRYTLFRQETSTRQSGDLELSGMRLGWLSTQAWLTAKAANGKYTLWSVPRQVRMYANSNAVAGPNGTNTENAISPRYDMEINASAATASVRAVGVKYPVDVTDPSKTISISQLSWNDLPLRWNATGFTSTVAEFTPSITGKIGKNEIKPNDFVIRNFSLIFNADYDSPRRASFELHQLSTGLTLAITSTLDYHLPSTSTPSPLL